MAEDQKGARERMSQNMRDMAEASVAQARSAFEQYLSATERAMNTLADSTEAAWTGARDVNQRLVAFADANAKAAFEYAERYFRAKDAKEAMSVQQEFLRTQAERLNGQLRELGELSTRAAREAANLKK
jgi:phasin